MMTMLSTMPRSAVRCRIIGLLLALAALLAGCSSLRFAYNSAPELAYWWLDGYADFDDTQALRMREHLASWQRWHRRTQLTDYAAWLARVRAVAAEPATPAQVCRLLDEAMARLDVALDQAVPSLADMALTLTPAQLAHIERRYAKGNDEFREEFVHDTPAKRLAPRVRRTVERAQSLYGRLDAAQRERIAAALGASPFDAESTLAERRARQADIVQTLRRIAVAGDTPGPAQRDAARAALRGVVHRLQRSPRAEHAAYQQQLTQYNCRFAAELHNLTTPAQRSAAADKLRGWEEDLRALAADPR
jgi:hypothetical protein